MSSRNVETAKAAHQAFNKRDFDGVVSVMTNDIAYHDRARDIVFRGKEEYRQFAKGWVEAFPDAEISEPSYIDAGDIVVAQFTGRGKNDGPLGQLAPTGKSAHFGYCEILRFNETGKVVAIDAYYDQLSLLIQLGHVPAAQATVAAT
jgi:ketosteroid isomerase-like protein